MRFVKVDHLYKPVDLQKIGRVEYVAYLPREGEGQIFLDMFPNGATVNGRTLCALGTNPIKCWELVTSKDYLVKEFGID